MKKIFFILLLLMFVINKIEYRQDESISSTYTIDYDDENIPELIHT